MRLFRVAALALAPLAICATAAQAGDGAGPWSASASHLNQSSSTATVATVVGNGPGPGVFNGSGPGVATLESRAAVSASSSVGKAAASAEGYHISLFAGPSIIATDSGSFLDTLSNFDSSTGIMSGRYRAIFKESTGELDSLVIGGGLSVNILIDYLNFTDETYSDSIDFATSDCVFVPDVCRTTRTFNFKEVPQSITVSMFMGTMLPGGVNQTPHDYEAQLDLAFGEVVGNRFVPVDYDSAAGARVNGGFGIPEPASWALMIVGFAGVGSGLRASRRRKPALAA